MGYHRGETGMIEHALNPAPLQVLKAQLHGELICPNDCRYDAARKVWNGMIDKYPALIVCCADAADVVHAIQFARAHHLLVAVRRGGHSVTGRSVSGGGPGIGPPALEGICIEPE